MRDRIPLYLKNKTLLLGEFTVLFILFFIICYYLPIEWAWTLSMKHLETYLITRSAYCESVAMVKLRYREKFGTKIALHITCPILQ